MSNQDYTRSDLIELSESELKNITDITPTGCVFYADGGHRTIKGKPSSGFGLHVYFYTAEKPKGLGNFGVTKPTNVGYMERNMIDATKSEELVDAPVFLNVYAHAGQVTSAVAEILAVVQCINIFLSNKFFEFEKTLKIRTDNETVVKSINTYMEVWKRNNWRKSDGNVVKNLQLWKQVDVLIREVESLGVTVDIQHVYGHQVNFGNICADQMATMGLLSVEGVKWDVVNRDEFNATKLEFSPLFLDNQLVHFPGMRSVDNDGKYVYLAYTNQNSVDQIHHMGRSLVDSSIGLVYSEKPDEVLDKLLRSCQTLDEIDTPCPKAVNINIATKPRHDMELNPDYIAKLAPLNEVSRNDIKVKTTNDKVGLVMINPPQTSINTMHSYDVLNNIYIEYKAGFDKFGIVDITDLFYLGEVNGKGVTKYKFLVQQDLSVKVDLPVYKDGVTLKTVPTELTLGLDLPRRRILSTIKENNAKVVVITWTDFENITYFATIVTIDGADSIWSAEHTNYFIHGGTFT